MRGELEQSLAETYGRLTFWSAILMAGGWGWHLLKGDTTNWLIHFGIGLLLMTPILALAHLGWLARDRDRLTVRYCGAAILLIACALLIGLLLESDR